MLSRVYMVVAVLLLTGCSEYAKAKDHVGEANWWWVKATAFLIFIGVATKTVKEWRKWFAERRAAELRAVHDEKEKHRLSDELVRTTARLEYEKRMTAEAAERAAQERGGKIDRMLELLGSNGGSTLFARLDSQDMTLLRILSVLGGFIVHSEVGMWRSDADGFMMEVNEPWTKMTGLTESNLMGRGYVSALHPDDCVRVEGEFSRARADCRHFNSIHRYLQEDGSVVRVRVSAQPIKNKNHKCEGFIGFIEQLPEE